MSRLVEGTDRSPSPALSEALPEYVTNAGEATSRPSSSLPPSYSIPRPSQPLTYTFTPFTSGTTLLMPPQTVADLSPAYNISVALDLNPFVPLSYITTIRQGGTAAGQVVGSFELSINQRRGSVTIGMTTKRLANVLWSIQGSLLHWDWSISDTGAHLRWDCRSTLDDGSPMCVCYDSLSSHQLATFIPPPLDANPPIPDAELTVFPQGWDSFDEILISALVLERKRGLAF